MDAERIRQEMNVTRASIDRKLDALAVRTAAAKRRAVPAAVAAAAAVAALFGVWWWRHRVYV